MREHIFPRDLDERSLKRIWRLTGSNTPYKIAMRRSAMGRFGFANEYDPGHCKLRGRTSNLRSTGTRVAAMRAALYQGHGKPFEIHELPDPAPGTGELVLKVLRCGICGSDIEMTAWENEVFPRGS